MVSSIRFIKIEEYSEVNGPGLRSVVWTCGCHHNCEGCHNPQTHDPANGDVWTYKQTHELLNTLRADAVTGLTFSGGDPLTPYNATRVMAVCQAVKKAMPHIDIWIYTGHTIEEAVSILENAMVVNGVSHGNGVKYVDSIVAGKFEQDKKVTGKYYGSSNQNVYMNTAEGFVVNVEFD